MGKTACFLLGVWMLMAGIAGAAVPPPNPDYPRVNPCTWYEVDPNWPQKPAEFKWAAVPGVAVDKDDNVWMFTRTTPAIQVYAPDGHYLFGWGDTTGSHFLRIDHEGFIWTSDVGKHVVQKHERDGRVLMTLGIEGEAGTDDHHFFKPTDVAFSSKGDIFVSDGYGNARIVHFTKNGEFVKAWGALGTADGQFSIPHSIAIDSKDRIYVADRNNARVQIYNMSGEFLDSWKNLCVPWEVLITDKDEIWVCGSSPMPWWSDAKYPGALLGCPPIDQLVMKFDTSGKVLELHMLPKALDGQEKPGELNWLHGMAFDSKGNLYAGDIIGKRLQKFVVKK
jgi:hypothetical protein